MARKLHLGGVNTAQIFLEKVYKLITTIEEKAMNLFEKVTNHGNDLLAAKTKLEQLLENSNTRFMSLNHQDSIASILVDIEDMLTLNVVRIGLPECHTVEDEAEQPSQKRQS